MSKSTKQNQHYAHLDAILDFAYGTEARRQASRERNKTIANLLKKKPAANDGETEVQDAA